MDYKASIVKGLVIGVSIFIGYKTSENVYNYTMKTLKCKNVNKDENKDETIYIKEDYFAETTKSSKEFTKLFD